MNSETRMDGNAALVLFRILFGFFMLLECWGAIATGWVGETFVEPKWTFPLIGFEGLRFLSGPVMYGYFVVMGLFAAGVMLGIRYRLSAFGLALMWTGAYLGQKSHYNNHYYLAALIAWGLLFLPAHARASWDVQRGAVQRSHAIDAWVPRAFRILVWIVFTYAAISKLYPGWLSGDYLRTNFASKGDRWLIGPLLVQPGFQEFVRWSAILFDGLVVPALLWRPTRAFAWIGMLVFNLFNSLVFHIGIFPYMVLGLTAFFFPTASLERWFGWLIGGSNPSAEQQGWRIPRLGRVGLFAFLAVQLLLPLRHHLYRGEVAWTEEGHRMSWRMMLRTKSGSLAMEVVEQDTGQRSRVDLGDYLSPNQVRRAATKPEFVLQLARLIEADFHARGKEVAIFATSSRVSLNGGPWAPLIDPEVDLARASWRPFRRDAWVLDPPRSTTE